MSFFLIRKSRIDFHSDETSKLYWLSKKTLGYFFVTKNVTVLKLQGQHPGPLGTIYVLCVVKAKELLKGTLFEL